MPSKNKASSRFRIDRFADCRAGQRRHENFRLEAGHYDPRSLRHLSRQNALLDQENIGIETCPLVPSPHLGHQPIETHFLTVRQRSL